MVDGTHEAVGGLVMMLRGENSKEVVERIKAKVAQINSSNVLPNGLQIVPGVAFPIGAGPSSGDHGVILYLSFEHPWPALVKTIRPDNDPAHCRVAPANLDAPSP